MPKATILPSDIKNKHKRENLYHKLRKEKAKAKSDRRKQLAKDEEKNPELKEVRMTSDLELFLY
jgi:ribosome production factor 1